jgi:hypothetical protein
MIDDHYRPSVLFRPTLRGPYPYAGPGNAWIVEYGGVQALGDSPDDAMRAFDAMWVTRVAQPTKP